MSGIELINRLRTDPQLRESLRTASPEQKITILKEEGFSSSEVNNIAARISNSSNSMFKNLQLGKGPCFD